MKYYFPHEKLEVYNLELQFIKWATPIIASSKKKGGSIAWESCHHLERASLSFLFNTAEGNGKRELPGSAKFFDDARGSVAECASCLDALVAKGLLEENDTDHGKVLLSRIYAILSKLIEKYEDKRKEKGN